jgi:hypothetical protein
MREGRRRLHPDHVANAEHAASGPLPSQPEGAKQARDGLRRVFLPQQYRFVAGQPGES